MKLLERAYVKLCVMFPESLASMEYLFAVRTSPGQPLLVKLLLVRLPVRLGLQRFIAERTRKVLGCGGVRDGRQAGRCGRETR